MVGKKENIEQSCWNLKFFWFFVTFRQRMGNMEGWGGPLTSNWHAQQMALQHKILQGMRSIGIIPVLPAFAGHVPKAIARYYRATVLSINFCVTMAIRPRGSKFTFLTRDLWSGVFMTKELLWARVECFCLPGKCFMRTSHETIIW